MIREIRQHGLTKGIRVWFTWASVHDIETLTRNTRIRRWFWTKIFRRRLNPHHAKEGDGE